MTCEIYERLIESSLLQVNSEPECRFDSHLSCPQTEWQCVWGRLIIKADQKSKERAVTSEDRSQDKNLAELEAGLK